MQDTRTIDFSQNPINLNRLIVGQSYEVDLSDEIPWLNEVLKEYSQKKYIPSEELPTGKELLEFAGSLKKVKAHHFGDLYLLKGDVSFQYYARCVNTLTPFLAQDEFEVKAAFLPERWEHHEETQDLTEYFFEDDVYDLFFLTKEKLNLALSLDELISLHVEEYPKLKEFSLPKV